MQEAIGDRIRAYFRRRHRVEGDEVLERIAWEEYRREYGEETIWETSWRTGIIGMR